MIEKILHQLYHNVPLEIRNIIGHSRLLKSLRDGLLRHNGSYKESMVHIKRAYFDYKMEFVFFASIKAASKAKNLGIENTILDNSIHLIYKFKKKEKNAIVLDIGASFGYLSLVWANSISKNGKVIAFEPNRNAYNSFNKSINANNLKSIIQLNNQAVGIKDGWIDLFHNSSSSNTLKIEGEKQKKTTINLVSVDSFTKRNGINDCDLVKIDVDGIELDILKGSQELIENCKPIFIVETNGNEEIIEFFNGNHYEILDMKLIKFVPGNELPLNIFCIPKSNNVIL